MASIGSILNTARQGLFAQQVALQVASQNIANVNTEGYTRQRASFTASRFGDGVSVMSIERLRDRFLDIQMRSVLSEQGASRRLTQNLQRIESLLDETENQGVNQRLSELFAAFHDLAANPSGVAERETVRTRAELLASLLNHHDETLANLQREADDQIKQNVVQINNIVSQIAALNSQLVSTSVTQGTANDNELLDQRNQLVEQLSELAEVNSFIDPHGALTVMIGRGTVMVEGSHHYTLEAVEGADGVDIDYVHSVNVRHRITSQFANGELGAALKVREEVIPELRARIDRFAAGLMYAMNMTHRGGVGLDGVGGRDLFEGLGGHGAADSGNHGGATVDSVVISDSSQLTIDAYEIRFTGAATFDIVNASTGATVSAGNAYTSGAAISFDGITATLSDASGPPQAGDVFHVDTFTGASASIRLSAAVAASTDALAAGLSAESGDNRNALALAALESASVAPGGSSTLGRFYESLITDLGIQVQEAELNGQRQELVVEQTRQMVLSASGVSVDEESASLILYQRAFEASARMVTVADKIYMTILDML